MRQPHPCRKRPLHWLWNARQEDWDFRICSLSAPVSGHEAFPGLTMADAHLSMTAFDVYLGKRRVDLYV